MLSSMTLKSHPPLQVKQSLRLSGCIVPLPSVLCLFPPAGSYTHNTSHLACSKYPVQHDLSVGVLRAWVNWEWIFTQKSVLDKCFLYFQFTDFILGCQKVLNFKISVYENLLTLQIFEPKSTPSLPRTSKLHHRGHANPVGSHQLDLQEMRKSLSLTAVGRSFY